MKCGLVFIPIRSNLLGQRYKKDSYFKKSPNIAAKKSFFSKSLLINIAKSRVKSALNVLEIDIKNKKVLDVGCSYGEILFYLKEKFNCKVFGIEASPQASSHGSNIFSVTIYPLLVEEFRPKEKFDVIWCSHLLEHVENLDLFVKKIKLLLKRNGFLYIEVPNILRPSGGFDLNTFLYSEHLQTFSTFNLYLFLEKHQINVIAYSDKGFLKFWCQVSKNKKNLKPNTLKAEEILNFLKAYKQNYNIYSYIKVYQQKLIYSISLLFYKIYDLYCKIAL